MKKVEKSTTTNSLFVNFLKFYLWLFVAFSTKIPQIKWPAHVTDNVIGIFADSTTITLTHSNLRVILDMKQDTVSKSSL